MLITAFALCAAVLTLLTLLVVYQWALAVVSMLPRRRRSSPPARGAGFCCSFPPTTKRRASRPHSRASGRSITRRPASPSSSSPIGATTAPPPAPGRTASRVSSGAAACRARGRRSRGRSTRSTARACPFDALMLIDADTVVDAACLEAFDEDLRSGHDVQQGYNYLSNPWDSPFTRIISVTSVLRNGLFYAGKERIGLPAMLSGCGMCFSRRIIEQSRLDRLFGGRRLGVLGLAVVERRNDPLQRARARAGARVPGFQQASRQRLRWASGRHAVAGTSAAALLKAGVRRRRVDLCDAALTISAPTYSAQATLALFCLAGSLLLSRDPAWRDLAVWAGGGHGVAGGLLRGRAGDDGGARSARWPASR